MKKFQEIERAKKNAFEIPNIPSKRDELIEKLERVGHYPICVGRSIIVIEQCEENDDLPDDVKGWNTLRLSIYCDQNVFDDERPRFLYIQANRFGQLDLSLQERGSNEIAKSIKLV